MPTMKDLKLQAALSAFSLVNDQALRLRTIASPEEKEAINQQWEDAQDLYEKALTASLAAASANLKRESKKVNELITEIRETDASNMKAAETISAIEEVLKLVAALVLLAA